MDKMWVNIKKDSVAVITTTTLS